VQVQNETTPVASEAEENEPAVQQKRRIKKKKAEKLIPKKLPFQVKEKEIGLFRVLS